MKVVNVLGNEQAIHAFLLVTVLLELGDGFVTIVHCLIGCKLDEVVVPLPDSHRVLVEVLTRADLHRISLRAVNFCTALPEAIVAAEGRNTARCTDASSSHDRDLFAPY